MRNINLEHSDYDSMNFETWHDVQQAYLLTPHIVLANVDTGLWLYCYDEAIEEHSTSAIAKQATIITLDIGGASVAGMDLAEIAHIPLVELAKLLAAQRLSQ